MNQNKMAEFLYQLRKERGWTQQEVAKRIFITREAVSKWERGVNTPDVPSLMLLSKLYDISVNEILYGERQNKTNKEKVENATLNALDYTNNKYKKAKKISLIAILLLVISVLIFYFLYTYNSLKVYVLSSDNSKFEVEQGIIVTTKEKTYIRLGNINNNTEEEIMNIRLVYKYKNKEIELLNSLDTDSLIIDLNKYKEFLKHDNKYKTFNNLYLIVKTKNYEETIKLDTHLDFSNKYFFPKETESNDEIKNDSKEIEIPENILKKFKLNKNGEYEIISQYNNKKLILKLQNGVVTFQIDKKLEFSGTVIVTDKVINISEGSYYCVYDIGNNKSITDNCKKYEDIINFIITTIFN